MRVDTPPSGPRNKGKVKGKRSPAGRVHPASKRGKVKGRRVK